MDAAKVDLSGGLRLRDASDDESAKSEYMPDART